ncbi:hypothetical protein [Kitasatospora viridis]|uniref:Uncharacterized protein n=1 Tax=Kitasatospora viridis TaxID=281105 RepID=A0A561SEZ6_9ACTN|nr:hypothetical protein [Kitasatospora viridis]TWF73446.1 hypothetical protein FHX73_1557 [Kitasatospora viridis]
MPEMGEPMKNLMSSVYGGIDPEIPDAVRHFIEEITFAAAEDILPALRGSLTEDWMALPVWARNLAFRLACLQRPDDLELLREAAADLRCFGPDWDEEADALKARAARLEPGRGSVEDPTDRQNP